MNDRPAQGNIERFPLIGTELTGTIRILVVDDNPEHRQQITDVCHDTDLNLHIVEATSLASMQTALDRTRFDILFIDHQLADGDGLQALDIIQQHDLNAGAAAVMVSGEAHVDVAVTALKNGCVDYIYKESLQVATMRRAIVAAIQRAGLRQSMRDAERQRTKLLSTLRQLGDTCADQLRPNVDTLRRKLSAIRLQLRRGAVHESEAHLSDLDVVWQRLAIYCDQLEKAARQADP